MAARDLQDKILDFITITVLGLAVFQIVSIILTAIFPSIPVLKLGIGFLIFAVAGSILGVLSIIRGVLITKMDRNQITFVVLATAASILFLFYAPDLLPEIFDRQALINTMSVIGL